METIKIIKPKEFNPLSQGVIYKEFTEAEQTDLTIKEKAKRIIAEVGKAKFAVKEKVNKVAKSAKKSKETENQNERNAMPATKTINELGLQIKSTTKTISPSLYESEIRIVTSGSNSNQVNKLEQGLGLIDGLQLLLIGGSIGEGTEFVVSTDKPILLINTLKEMFFIEQVKDNGKIIQVTMKT